MIQRVVLVQLRDDLRSAANRRQIAAHAREILSRIALVHDLQVQVAADGRTRGSWDLCLLLRLQSLEDTERYRVDPVHRAFADQYLKPLQKRIRVYHFEIDHLEGSHFEGNEELGSALPPELE